MMNIPKLFCVLITIIVFNTYKVQATTYYVSFLSGNDNNSGTTISSAFQSINQINTIILNPGDSVLFKRAEMWRGQLLPSSGNSYSDTYYGAYGTGPNPTILGSQNYSNIDDWVNIGPNIWECTETFSTDIGNIIFDNETSVGFKKWKQSDLQSIDDFWFDLITGKLLIYATSNPATIHTEIELALRQHVIDEQNASFVTYENLSLKYGGAHGIGGGNTNNISIISCEISYMGGGDLLLDGVIRFGNGIEFWGNASNNIVEKCKIWEIYDSGITNQSNVPASTQQNISYRNNIIWNCGLASYEYWNRPESSQTSEIYFEHNTCLNAGSGWGNQRPDYQGSQVILDTNTAETDSIYIRNNIFYGAQRFIYAIKDDINGTIQLDYNAIHQVGFSDSLFIGFPSFVNYTIEDLVAYSNYTGYDSHSITHDPAFINISALDFQLTSSSPCIDVGIETTATEDFGGNKRPSINGYDMGAYEYTLPLNIETISSQRNLKTYPNPVRDKLTIDNSEQSIQQLAILNMTGSTMVYEKTNPISKTITLDVSHLKPGVYVLVITNQTTKSLSMNFLKE